MREPVAAAGLYSEGGDGVTRFPETGGHSFLINSTEKDQYGFGHSRNEFGGSTAANNFTILCRNLLFYLRCVYLDSADLLSHKT